MTIKFYHIQGRTQGKVENFEQSVIRIGRHPSNDLSFDPNLDREVSGNHAQIRFENGVYLLYDLKSVNGTLVNQQLIQQVILKNGDQVQFGKDGPICQIEIIYQQALFQTSQEIPPAGSYDPNSNPQIICPQGPTDSPYPDQIASGPIILGDMSQPQAAEFASTSEYLNPAPGYQNPASPPMANIEPQYAQSPTPVWGQASPQLNLPPRPPEPPTSGQGPQPRKTLYYKAIMADMLKKSSNRMKIAITIIVVLLIAGAGVGAFFFYLYLQVEKERDEALLIKKVGKHQLNAQQKELANIANNLSKSIFLLIFRYKNTESGFCTAFAIDKKGILATNAHCIDAIRKMQYYVKNLEVLARMNNTSAQHSLESRVLDPGIFRVVNYLPHAGYDGRPFSADVGLLKLDLRGIQIPSVIPFASLNKIYHLQMGERIFTIGYPGQVMQPKSPVATFRDGSVSRLTDYTNTSASVEKSKLLWHNFLTSKGTSGSPILDQEGKLIGLNNGAMDVKQVKKVDPNTGQVKYDYIYSAAGLNFGIRADVLLELLAQVKKYYKDSW